MHQGMDILTSIENDHEIFKMICTTYNSEQYR